MNSKQVKKLRQIQRKQMTEIPKEVEEAIQKAFLMGVDVGRKKEREENGLDQGKCSETQAERAAG